MENQNYATASVDITDEIQALARRMNPTAHSSYSKACANAIHRDSDMRHPRDDPCPRRMMRAAKPKLKRTQQMGLARDELHQVHFRLLVLGEHNKCRGQDVREQYSTFHDEFDDDERCFPRSFFLTVTQFSPDAVAVMALLYRLKVREVNDGGRTLYIKC